MYTAAKMDAEHHRGGLIGHLALSNMSTSVS
jgi:hypothetical protein